MATNGVVGTGPGRICRLTRFDGPPPGEGFNTMMAAVDAVAISSAVICAVSRVSPSTVVGRGLPFQRSTAPVTNPEPLTVSVNAPPPASKTDGLSEFTTGTGAAESETPVRATVCGLPGASSVMTSVAVREPAENGEKTTLMAQLAPGASVAGQGLV